MQSRYRDDGQGRYWDGTPEEEQEYINDHSRIASDISAMTQNRLDDFASTRGYDNVNSISKYKDITDAEIASSPTSESIIVSRYRLECRYLALAASRTWAVLENIYSDVISGNRTAPLCFADIEPELPELIWP